MGRLQFFNEKHNISNIICNARGWKTGNFVGIGETNSPDCSWMVAKQVTDTLFGDSLLGKL